MQQVLTEEQALIRSSALDWLASNYDFRQREAGVHRDGGAPAAWSAFAELGWLALPLPEDAGGIGGGPVETGLLLQAMGRHLVVEPYVEAVVQAARLLALAGNPAQKERWLPPTMDGSVRLAFAHAEPGDALPWEPRRCVARREAGGWRLDGAKQQVASGASAQRWIVSARDASGEGATLLFLVDPGLPGIEVDAYDTTHGARAADAVLRGVALDCDSLLGDDPVRPSSLLLQVLAEGIVAQCWQALGAMQAVLEQTTQYTQQRRQFGQALSQFQVVQHRLAEMAVQVHEAQAACELAAMRLTRNPADGRAIAASVKSKVTRAARFVSQEAVQLHGAMGVCEELPVAATFRMLLAFAQTAGSAADHATHLGAALLADGGFARSATLEEAP
jgi:alkylation response protein AidB-like acyl-CoA dehydrogenase